MVCQKPTSFDSLSLLLLLCFAVLRRVRMVIQVSFRISLSVFKIRCNKKNIYTMQKLNLNKNSEFSFSSWEDVFTKLLRENYLGTKQDLGLRVSCHYAHNIFGLFKMDCWPLHHCLSNKRSLFPIYHSDESTGSGFGFKNENIGLRDKKAPIMFFLFCKYVKMFSRFSNDDKPCEELKENSNFKNANKFFKRLQNLLKIQTYKDSMKFEESNLKSEKENFQNKILENAFFRVAILLPDCKLPSYFSRGIHSKNLQPARQQLSLQLTKLLIENKCGCSNYLKVLRKTDDGSFVNVFYDPLMYSIFFEDDYINVTKLLLQNGAGSKFKNEVSQIVGFDYTIKYLNLCVSNYIYVNEHTVFFDQKNFFDGRVVWGAGVQARFSCRSIEALVESGVFSFLNFFNKKFKIGPKTLFKQNKKMLSDCFLTILNFLIVCQFFNSSIFCTLYEYLKNTKIDKNQKIQNRQKTFSKIFFMLFEQCF